MTTATITVDHEIVRDSFRQWHAEQEELDAQLADSVAALEAYQSHLDQWHESLAREREEVQQLRAALERDQAIAGNSSQQLDQLHAQLDGARQQVSTLTTELLTQREELRNLERLRVEADGQLAQAQAREKELAAALEAHETRLALERQAQNRAPVPANESTAGATPTQPVGREPASESPLTSKQTRHETERPANPVLGSVIEQFGKLRQQRAAGRQNYPRPR